jgi:hypothetical protein
MGYGIVVGLAVVAFLASAIADGQGYKQQKNGLFHQAQSKGNNL